MARLSDSITYGNHAITGDATVNGILTVAGTQIEPVSITGTGATSVTGTYPDFTVSSTDNNFYLSGLSFNTTDGILTATVSGTTNQTVDLDGRYLLQGATAADSQLLDGQDGLFYQDASNLISGTISDARLPASISSDITGNAATATALQTARSIALGGDVSGSASFNGTANITITATVADDSHNHIIANVDGLQTALNGKLDVGATAANSQLLDSINSTSFLRSDTADTMSGRLTYTNADPIDTGRGINGGYGVSTGSGTAWGANIWGMGDTYDGSGTGTSFATDASQYGLTWLRDTHPSITATIVNEGLYLYRAGNKIAGMGYSGHWFSNEIRATGDIIAFYSDERLKDFHGTIPSALEKITKLNGYYFTENELAKKLGYKNDKMQLGVSAQEVQEVFPEAVEIAAISYDDNVDEEYLTVKYEKLVPGLIEAIKEQQAQIDELKELVNKLTNSKK